MDVLDGPESLLPKLKLNRGVKLSEPSVKMTLKGISIGKVDGVSLV